jgi:protein-L-isoaspartate(D-aspartate) O-methyltransferase
VNFTVNMTRDQLFKHLESNTRVLKNKLVRKAFADIDRADFVAEDYITEAYDDYPLPIGEAQTISQPTTVAFMLELLNCQRHQKVLDIGSGSGWTTALLAHIVGKQGQVIGVELLPKLVSFGQNNIVKYDFPNARIMQAERNTLGLVQEAPFDRILVSASADKLPRGLLQQLGKPGIMVIPVRDAIYRVVKDEDGKIEQTKYKGFVFVPLVVEDK